MKIKLIDSLMRLFSPREPEGYGIKYIISEETYKKSGSLKLNMVRIDTIIVDGQPAGIYAFVHKTSPKSFRNHDMFMELYALGDFDSARRIALINAQESFGGELAEYYHIMAVRCANLYKTPPKSWNGVYRKR